MEFTGTHNAIYGDRWLVVWAVDRYLNWHLRYQSPYQFRSCNEPQLITELVVCCFMAGIGGYEKG